MDPAKQPICIVGSGLSGISAAKALLSHGIKVLMIDPGLDLSIKTQASIEAVAQRPSWQWTNSDRSFLRAGVESSTKGVKEKRLFGSNFASHALDCFQVEKENASFYMSFARAGLGNIWGAGLLPMHSDDMEDWPIDSSDLAPHYKSVLQFMPQSARQDRLETLFPLQAPFHYHGPSRQASRMLARLERHAHELERRGFFFGASRLAGCYHGDLQKFDCQYCGTCLYGCPYGIIYTGRTTIDEMALDPNFEYRPGLVAVAFSHRSDSVEILVTDTTGRQLESIRARRVLLACGPFATAKIVLESLNLHDTAVYAKTTDQYYLPFFAVSAQPDIEHEHLHTMCQAFWVIANERISPYLVHSSIYTYNDLFARAVQSMLGPLYGPLKKATNIPLSRLYFTITYLHSKHSAGLKLSLATNRHKALRVEGLPNIESAKVFKSIRRYWTRLTPYTGLFPVPFYPSAKLPGAGNHSGGTFPMTQNPSRLETDTLGRLPGVERVHLIDSSVFPSITATTITFTIMANAYRIGDRIVKEGLHDI